ncbi:MAG TPA: ribonuclease R [Thermoanaerobaculia bacterium]|nr:ribonuclease R [Thermoanaerobaculia bacterium]
MLPTESQVLEKLRQKGSRVLSFAQLAGALAVPEEEEEAFRARLDVLERQGKVARVRGEKYSAIEHTGFVAGKISIRAEGFGFVLSPELHGEDLYIPRRGLGGALDGDLVLAREQERKPAKQRGPRRMADRVSGTVIKILERARDRIVGQYDAAEGRSVVRPYNPRMATEVRVPKDAAGDAVDSEIVVAKFTSYPDDRRIARGEIVERLGFLGEPGVDIEIVIRSHDLPSRFPNEVEAEANAFSESIDPADLTGRHDFRHHTIVTIDGETAKDFDDAVEVDKTADGYRLGVHIADVSHYVEEGTRLDAEGRWRGTSVYFPGRVVPMLPERLSNGLCSLNPRVDRFTLSVGIDFDAAGRVKQTVFTKGVICSAARMTYTEVARLLEHPAPDDERHYGGLVKSFRVMRELATVLRKRREARGSIDFDLPSAAVMLDDEGYVIGIRPESRNVAHTIIEEFMLAANEAVAKHLFFAKEPAIYRVHDRPDPDKLVDLRETLETFGYELKGNLEEVPPAAFQKLLKQIEGKPEERFLTDLLLRSQRKAVYSAECRGHYALAAPYYGHFTSPIRRYPDLIVHRALTRLLASRRPFPADELELRSNAYEELGRESSERERRAETAERESLLWKKIVFLRDKIGRSFDAYVSGVAAFGVFVTLSEYLVEGLVPVSTLSDDFYVYEEKGHRLRGRSSGKIYRLGDAIRVQLVAIDEVQRRVDFRPEGERREGAPRRPPERPARRAPEPAPRRPPEQG